jgi:predicted nucleotidyltransferase
MKTRSEYIRLLRAYRRQHAAEYGIKRMGIFGSVARNEQKEGSDIDIYYEGLSMGLKSLVRLPRELEDALGAKEMRQKKKSYLRSLKGHKI